MHIYWIKHIQVLVMMFVDPDYLYKMIMVKPITHTNRKCRYILLNCTSCVGHPYHPSSHTQTHHVEQILIHSISCVLQSCSSLFATQTHYIMAWAVNIWRPNNGHRLFVRFCCFCFFKSLLISWLDDQDYNSLGFRSFSLPPPPFFLHQYLSLMEFVSKAERFLQDKCKSSCNWILCLMIWLTLCENILLYQLKAWFLQHACQSWASSTLVHFAFI